jgi:hypothetical protein
LQPTLPLLAELDALATEAAELDDAVVTLALPVPVALVPVALVLLVPPPTPATLPGAPPTPATVNSCPPQAESPRVSDASVTTVSVPRTARRVRPSTSLVMCRGMGIVPAPYAGGAEPPRVGTIVAVL